jgi:hypothetical protein
MLADPTSRAITSTRVAATVAIRVPSLAALFDEWSPQPLERRPLSDAAREKIVDSWIDAGRGRGEPRPTRLELTLPGTERRDGLEPTLLAAFRHDMEAMRVDAKRHWFRRSFEGRETRIGLLVFLFALLVAAALDFGAKEGSVETIVSQTFVVLAWVALWEPAYRLMTAASYRLGHASFAELAAAEVEILWD